MKFRLWRCLLTLIDSSQTLPTGTVHLESALLVLLSTRTLQSELSAHPMWILWKDGSTERVGLCAACSLHIEALGARVVHSFLGGVLSGFQPLTSSKSKRDGEPD